MLILVFGLCLSLYLAHAYCDLAHAYCDLAHAYSSIYYIPTWISVMRIWHMRIFPSLKKRMSQGPAVCRYDELKN